MLLVRLPYTHLPKDDVINSVLISILDSKDSVVFMTSDFSDALGNMMFGNNYPKEPR